MQISEFSAWLRTQTNKHKRPFQEETARGYAETARALNLWMAAEDNRRRLHRVSLVTQLVVTGPARGRLLNLDYEGPTGPYAAE